MIDDDPEDLDMANELVKGLHVPNRFISFSEPLTALSFLQTQDDLPMFIICDVNMPKMDGFELRTELLKHPGMEKIPFFFLSTSKSHGETVLAQECKADGYYQKAGTFLEQEKIFDQMFVTAKGIWDNR